MRSEFEIKEFIDAIEAGERNKHRKKGRRTQEKPEGHALILKRDTPHDTHTLLVDWKEVRKLETGVDMEYLVQWFIRSSRGTSTTTRLFYFNPSSKLFFGKVDSFFISEIIWSDYPN